MAVICRHRSDVTACSRECLEQPGPRRLPVPLDSCERYSQRLTGFREGKSGEEPKFCNLALARIKCGELGQRGVEVEDVDVHRRRDGLDIVESDTRPLP